MDFQLDRLLGFPSLSVHHISQEGNHLKLSLIFINEEATCPHCLQKTGRINQSRPATVRDLSLSGKFVSLTVDRRQFKCEGCSKLFTEVLEGFDFLHHSTLRYQEGTSINRVGSTALTDLNLMLPWLVLLKLGFFEVPKSIFTGSHPQ